MSFKEWYKKIYKSDWHNDYAELYGYANKMASEYEIYCKSIQKEPVWD